MLVIGSFRRQFGRLREIGAKVFADNFAKHPAGGGCFEGAIEARSSLYAPVSKKPPNRFIVAGVVTQIDRRRGMPELMQGD